MSPERQPENNKHDPAPALGELGGNTSFDAAHLTRLLTAEEHSPSALIDLLSKNKRFAVLYDALAVREGYSVGEHTLSVISQFEKYFSQADLPLPASFYRLTFALHDIGKGVAASSKRQHAHTLRIIDSIGEDLPCSADEMRIMRAVIGGDALGGFIKSVLVNAPKMPEKILLARKLASGDLTREEILQFGSGIGLCAPDKFTSALDNGRKAIIAGAQAAGIAPDQYFDIFCPYYQVDTLGYTSDTPREQARSSHLFLPGENASLATYHNRLNALEEEILSPAQSQPERYSNILSEYYRILNSAAELKRCFPSLEFLYAKEAPGGSQELPEKLFPTAAGKKRMQFAAPIEEAVSILRDTLRS